ncbi:MULTISPECIES: hypothetical protein [unclassified Streptomyces]|uniref:hypothetical protein n=1 Tax=unclassified Streptomyces TaxID=2593676 RepID=UPI001F03C1F7|nr:MULTISPECIES: hypothetical protein [unclassified Streptomyces]MCH0563694.1 hypothetical protein [Streptomyces sp. MUM 2J]MCH0573438.1 hypothetical protein [Streptomyces sp. MUM 136J]
MVRRPVAWAVALLLFAEALGIAAVNWFLGVLADRQHMSLAGLDPDVMATSSKVGGVVFGLYFALCGLVALLVAVRDRAPAGLGRVLLISAAVVHGLLGAFAWGLLGWTEFLFMVAVLALIVLLLMTYDAQQGPGATAAPPATSGAPAGGAEAEDGGRAPQEGGGGLPRDGDGAARPEGGEAAEPGAEAEPGGDPVAVGPVGDR